ncbi:MAG: radical SAM family heme chaperone HemW [Kiritimatiellia bacterium]
MAGECVPHTRPTPAEESVLLDSGPERNLYVHVPFCATKCRYCAFYSRTGTEAELLRAYPGLVARELSLRGVGADWRPQTIYIGGGTPSLLGTEGFMALFAALPKAAEGAEITVELNPGDVTPELAMALRTSGVTRASLGVQSFDEKVLRWLGRRHGAKEIRDAHAALRDAGIPQISFDFIIGEPNFPKAVLESSLREAIELAPEHISVYPLSIEPGTKLAQAGVKPLDDDSLLDGIARAEVLLSEAGYLRYELSNYAKDGAFCRHNLAVWRGRDYIGIGPAACSREGFERRANAACFEEWKDAVLRGELPPAEVTRYTREEDESERFATRVRLAAWTLEGTNGKKPERRERALETLRKTGMVEAVSPHAWWLTARGREVADAVMAELA